MARPPDIEREIYRKQIGLTRQQARRMNWMELSRLCRMDESARRLICGKFKEGK